MYKQRIASPYKLVKGIKHTTFNVRNVPGVYIVYKGKEIIYVGFSKNNLYRTLYRHFQDWSKSKQYRAVFNPENVKVRVVYTKTAKQAFILEAALIKKYDPIGNKYNTDLFSDEQKHRELEKFEEEPTKSVIQYEDDLPF